MKTFFFWVCCLAGGLVLGEEGLAANVRMLNGDTFSGRFRGFDNGYFEIDPMWGGTSLRFHAAYTGGLRFAGGAGRRDVHPSMRVRFVNGDRLSGRLIALSDAVLEMETLWGRYVTADRTFVKEIERLPWVDATIFRGLTPLSDWSVELPAGHPEPEPRDGEMFLPENGRLSRALPLPDAEGVLFETELSFPRGQMQATLELFQSSRRGRPLEGMVLTLNPNWMHVRTMDANGRQNWVLREPMLPDEASGRITVSAYLNVQSAEVILRINDVDYPPFPLHTEEPLAGRQTMEMVLQAGRDSGGIHLHYISYSRFSGVYAPDMTVEDPRRDLLVFQNGDRMEVELISMNEEGVVLRLEDQQEVTLPANRIRSVLPALRPSIHPRRGNRDVEVSLAERGDRLTLALTSLDADSLSGGSDLWRTLSAIPVREIRSVRLNIYQTFRYDDLGVGPPLFLFER